ncbi:hypothetical protein B0H11DRAFT_2095094 [Mycena galericulata]|nr:hypothetical protein B0H11DRAFT_2095094 [Mycena galericulata]
MSQFLSFRFIVFLIAIQGRSRPPKVAAHHPAKIRHSARRRDVPSSCGCLFCNCVRRPPTPPLQILQCRVHDEGPPLPWSFNAAFGTIVFRSSTGAAFRVTRMRGPARSGAGDSWTPRCV